jgi:uncharacterized protein YggU (UPF0235/DUF167 family)
MEKEIVTRKELYDLVWSVPLQPLSKKQAIAGVGRRNICVKMEIPLPKVGHRNKGLAAVIALELFVIATIYYLSGILLDSLKAAF